jgi:hypothetical protein
MVLPANDLMEYESQRERPAVRVSGRLGRFLVYGLIAAKDDEQGGAV